MDAYGDSDSNGPSTTSNEELHDQAEPTLDEVVSEFMALGEHATDYAVAKADAIRVRLRGLLVGFALRLCAVVLAVITVGSLWLSFLNGMRGGLEAATGRGWLADLLTGALGLGAAWAGMRIYRSRSARRAREHVVRKHERRKNKQSRRDRHAPDRPVRHAA